MSTAKKPEKPTVYLAKHISDPACFECLMALYTRLTGKDLTPEEIEEARQKHDAFLTALPKVAADPETLDTPVVPATSAGRVEWQESAEEEQ